MSILDRAIALCEKDAETYRVALPTDDEVEFRHVKGPDEVTKMESDAVQLVELIKKRTASKEILAVGVKDPVTIMQAHFLKTLHVASWVKTEKTDEDGKPVSLFEPDPEAVTMVDWLNMAAKVPFAFRSLWTRVDDEVTGRAALVRRQTIEDAKKASAETPNDSQSSAPVETAGESTPAN